MRTLLEILNGQAAKGLKKYGKAIDPRDKSFIEWIEEAQEELVDALVYLQAVKEKWHLSESAAKP